VTLDVTQPASWRTAVEQILSSHKRLDVLINNAGKHSDGLLATMPVSMWEEVLKANLDGAFHGCQAVLPTMISQRGGRIVNIASLSALLAPAGQANYADGFANYAGLNFRAPAQATTNETAQRQAGSPHVWRHAASRPRTRGRQPPCGRR